MAEEKKTFLTEREAAEYLGVSLHTLRAMETGGSLIPFRTLGGHCGYSLRMLNEYLGKSYHPRRREPESESKAPDVSLAPAPELQSHDSPLAALLLFDEAEQEPLEPAAQSAEPLPLQPPSPPLYLSPTETNVSKAQVVDAPEPMDEPDTPLSDGTSTQADASPTQTVDIPTIRIRVSSEDSIEVLGLSARTFNVLMYASIRTIGELLQAIESQILPWFAGGIGPKTMAEIEDSLARVWLFDAPEAALGPKAVAEESVAETDSHVVEAPLSQPPSPPPDPTPLDVLGLSIRPYNALRRSDITTIGQLAKMSDEEIRGVRNIGPKSLAEIKDKLNAYLAEHPLPDEEEESLPEPETQAVEPLPPQPPSPPPDPTPVEVLGLSIRPHNALRRSDITSVGQLARMSDEEIRGVRNIGPKSLAEIREKLQVYLAVAPTPATKVAETSAQDEPPLGTPLSRLDIPRGLQEELQAAGVQSIEEVVAYSEEELLLQLDIGYWDMFLLKQGLSQHSLALATKPPLHPLVESHTLTALYERGVPLGEIDIARLALPEAQEETLSTTGFSNVQELATASEYVLKVACFRWRPERVSEIKSRLNQYLSWLLQQNSWESEVSGQGVSPIYLIELSETSLEEIVKMLFASLPADRQQDVIKLRYGLFDGQTKSLEEIGELLGVTRERVRQIQQRSLKTLRRRLSREPVRAIIEVLRYAFQKAGGLLTEKGIVGIVESHIAIGDIDCRRAVCLIMEIDGRFVNLKKEYVWGLDSYPLKHVSAVNRSMKRLLETAQVPVSKADLLAQFKAGRFYEKNQVELPDEFLVGCLNTNRRLETLDEEYYGLKGRANSRRNRMVMILRELGCPAHYTEIARLTNELLPASKRVSDHVIHAQLQRESDVFVSADRGTYGLKEWGLERPSYYADIIAEVLEDEGHPLPAGEILKRVEEIRPAKKSTVMMTLTMHPRFRQVDGETYGLRSWSLPGEDVEERSLPAGFLEDMKQRIFQRLIEQA